MAEPIRHQSALPRGYALHWYEIEAVIGQGGFGITYLARDTNLNHRVAIKEFFPIDLAVRAADNTAQPASTTRAEPLQFGLQRFLKEGQTVAKFRHRNIVAVHSVFEANQTAYMVMTYEHGQSLEEAFNLRQIQGEEALLKILFPVMDGLALIHDQGFIHRDLKPDNIVLRENGEPVVLDFGSARQALGVQTRTLTALVSPGYAPFEQYDGTTDGDKQGPWTDVYSLGATLYRGVAGRAPIDALARAGASLEGKPDVLIPATEVGRNLYSTHFLQAIDQALAFAPEQRPQSMQAWKQCFVATRQQPLSVPVEPPASEHEPTRRHHRATPATVPSRAGPHSEPAMPTGIPERVVTRRRPQRRRPARAWAALALIGGLGVASAYAWPIIQRMTGLDDLSLPWLDPVTPARTADPDRSPLGPDSRLAELEALQQAQSMRLAALAEERDRFERERMAMQQRLAELEAERGTNARRTEPSGESAPLEGDEVESARALLAELKTEQVREAKALAALKSEQQLEAARLAKLQRQVAVLEEQTKRARDAVQAAKRELEAQQLAHSLARERAASAAMTAELERQHAEQEVQEAARLLESEKAELERLAKAELERTAREAQRARRQQRITDLLESARVDLLADRLTSPPGQNAFARFLEVLDLEPDQAAARRGIERVVARLVELASQAGAGGNIADAERYVEAAKGIAPDADVVRRAEEQLEENRRESLTPRIRDSHATQLQPRVITT